MTMTTTTDVPDDDPILREAGWYTPEELESMILWDWCKS